MIVSYLRLLREAWAETKGRRELLAERDRYRDALQKIAADAVFDHPSPRDYANDVLHGATP